MKKIFLFLLALAFACNNFSGLVAMERKRRSSDNVKELIQEATGKSKEKVAKTDYFAQLNDGEIFRILINLPAKDIINFLAINEKFALLNKLLKFGPTPTYMGEDLRLFQQIQCKLATISKFARVKSRLLEKDSLNLFAHQILSEGKTLSVDLLENLLKILDSDTQRTLSQTYPIFEQTLRDKFGLTFIDQLNQLPDNALINIFSNITDPQNILNLCRLNHRFCWLITRLTPLRLNFYRKVAQEHLIQLLSHFKNIKSLIIENNNINNDFINFLNNHCHNLTELYLKNCDKLTNINLNCPHLTKLTLINGGYNKLTNLNLNCSNLTHLNLYSCNKLPEAIIHRILDSNPQLQTIKLYNCDQLENLTIHNCPYLTDLCLIYCINLETLIVNNSPILTQFYVRDCNYLGAITLLKNYHTLKKFSCWNNLELTRNKTYRQQLEEYYLMKI